MTQTELALSLGFSQSAATGWKRRGWLVFNADGSVDAEASKARLIEKRGHLGPMTSRERSKRSGWSHGPHCKTHGGFKSYQELRNG